MDMAHHEGDLVHMAARHETAALLPLLEADHVTDRIYLNRVAEWFQFPNFQASLSEKDLCHSREEYKNKVS